MHSIIELYQHPSPLFVEAFDDIIIELTGGRQKEGGQILAFCGTDPGVGTTTVVINLAISLALAKWNVLLVDEDMRKMRAHKHLSSSSLVGLSDYLAGRADLHEVFRITNHPNLHYLPGGEPVAHPLRLIGSRNFGLLMDNLTQHYNFILIDTPSIATANDLAAIAPLADKVFVVAEPGRSTKKNLADISRILGNDAEKMGGVIVNKVDEREYRSYRMHYDYFDKERYLTRKSKKKLKDRPASDLTASLQRMFHPAEPEEAESAGPKDEGGALP